ncbi:NCS1 family nucleobase:cation symporter-1 [Anatilimnocola floriformis]|uniref:NCS1 family nucleobase:cation symporter-1 n=1 Tax=Anatilimnocola floriformis TaxID=2948575 RepID=UPI0020C3D970|nr:NCS1 family nucleobase:cation symporter-1 [Anatilimnocola floriformis]
MKSTTTTAAAPTIHHADFVELHEDVSHSPLWNADLAPTTLAQRTWSTWHIAALWIGMSVVITTYQLAGGMISAGMTWWQALITILLGNTIVLIPMCLNAHAGTKYGVSFPVLLRSSFGTVGANVPAMLRAIVACGWFGIQTWIGGEAMDVLIGMMFPGWKTLTTELIGLQLHTWLALLLFWGVEVYFIIAGLEQIKHLESWGSPLLLIGGLALLGWCVWKAGGIGPVLEGSVKLQKEQHNFWAIFPLSLTGAVGYWATLSTNIPDFTRYARSQKSQMLGQALGLPTTMTLFAFIGIAVTSATVIIYGYPIPSPVDLMAKFNSIAIVLFATLIIFLAQLTTNLAANVVSPSNDFSNLNPRLISYMTGGLITAVIGMLMMPWKLMGDYFIGVWLVGYSGLMGAIGGIMICDYWVLRRQQLNLKELFEPKGRYSFSGGVNWRAIAALVLGIAPCLPGFLHAATHGKIAPPEFLKVIYQYAWFVTFGLGFVLYWLLMLGHPSVAADLEER